MNAKEAQDRALGEWAEKPSVDLSKIKVGDEVTVRDEWIESSAIVSHTPKALSVGDRVRYVSPFTGVADDEPWTLLYVDDSCFALVGRGKHSRAIKPLSDLRARLVTLPNPAILARAAELVGRPNGWRQHWFWDEGHTCFCINGAIREVAGEGGGWREAVFLSRMIGGGSLGGWNDNPSRTQSEVVAILSIAAQLAAETAA